MLEIPIAMILLSRLLPYHFNRWANIIITALYISLVIVTGTTDLDDTFHLIVEIAALSWIIWSAVQWRNLFPKQYAIDQAVSS